MLKYLDISDTNLEQLYTSQLLEALSAQSWQVHQLCSMTEQQQLQELSHWLQQMSLGLTHYDKPIQLQPTPGWLASRSVDQAVDCCVQAMLAWGILDGPCRLLQLLMLNMETGQRCGAYVPGWHQQVAVAMSLTADQMAVLRESWLRVKAARAALLQHHDQTAAQLAMLHDQYAADMACFEQALHVQFARSKSPTSVQHHQDNPYTQCHVPTSARSSWSSGDHQGLQQQQQQLSLTIQQQELLLTMNSQQQQELEGQLAAVKRQLSVLYAEQTMTLCNTLSKKQLAIAFVHSYPLLLDTFAICDAFDIMGWVDKATSSQSDAPPGDQPKLAKKSVTFASQFTNMAVLPLTPTVVPALQAVPAAAAGAAACSAGPAAAAGLGSLGLPVTIGTYPGLNPGITNLGIISGSTYVLQSRPGVPP
eukprot:gene13093-13220_t